MRLFVNASQVFGTGAVQVSVSFIQECLKFPENEYFVFISNLAAQQFDYQSFPDNFHFNVFEKFEATGFTNVKLQYDLKKREREIMPDCTFSVFGPTMWKPKSKHLVGYAYAYYVYPESPFFKIISKQNWLKIKIKVFVFKYLFNRNSDYFVSETEDVTERLKKFLGKSKNQYFTVTNSCNSFFLTFKSSENRILPLKKENEFRFVTLSTFASHKNLKILNEIIPILKKKYPQKDVKFILTVDEVLLKCNLTNEARNSIINLGRIRVDQCPQVYDECDALFLPTLLECFSASYAEAMQMNKPILTSDLSFAHTVCGNAALYFDPLNPMNIVTQMIEMISDKELRNALIKNGQKRIVTFDSAYSRAKKYLEICQQISH